MKEAPADEPVGRRIAGIFFSSSESAKSGRQLLSSHDQSARRTVAFDSTPARHAMRMMNPKRLIVQAILVWLTVTTPMGSHAIGPATLASATTGPVNLGEWTMRDAEGERILIPASEVLVVCFLGTECPLARLYGPRLQQLADHYEGRGVVVLGVNSNLQDSPAEIAEYTQSVGVKFPVAKDADQSIAAALDAKRTPEVFVIDRLGLVRYRGRIDDQYEPGRSRAEPTRHELRDAIDAVLAGKEVEHHETPGVGCLITRKPTATTDTPTITFARDIAPILNEHCVECHRDGEIGPFTLTDYDEVVGWGEMMLEVIDQGRMPPWHADPNVGSFVGERRMPRKSRDSIANWIDQGMPEGDAADLPELGQWSSGWHLPSSPDDEIVMRNRPFTIPADGVVDYQYYVVDPKWDEDRWITAAQVIPGDARVVHHAIVFVRPPDGSEFSGIGWLGAYVPGQRTVALPPGHARRIPAGSKLVFQMHYTPNGEQATDVSRVGVWFADPKTITHEVFTRVAINHEFEIPPKASDHEVRMTLDDFGPRSRLLGTTPHMHLRGKSFRLDVRRENQPTPEIVLNIPHYDFNWQHWYEFRKPIELDSVESIEMTVTFDNSVDNPVNPAPDDYVTWGDQTWEEMAIAFFDVAQPLGEKKHAVRKLVPENTTSREAKLAEIDRLADAFLREMDTNGDGVVDREETPITFQKFGFRNIDRNHDNRLDRDEIRESAADRL